VAVYQFENDYGEHEEVKAKYNAVKLGVGLLGWGFDGRISGL